jgi:uncharacterized protein YpmS
MSKKTEKRELDEPFSGFLQLYRMKINGIDYVLFGPPLTVDEGTITLSIQDFKVGEVLPAETVLQSIRLAMDPTARKLMMRLMQ